MAHAIKWGEGERHEMDDVAAPRDRRIQVDSKTRVRPGVAYFFLGMASILSTQ